MDDFAISYPEHAKLDAVKALSQPLGEFLDWLKSSGREIGHWDQGRYAHRRTRIINEETGETRYEMVFEEGFSPDPRPVNEWLADYFDIDLVKLDEEKVDMLDKQRAANDWPGNPHTDSLAG